MMKSNSLRAIRKNDNNFQVQPQNSPSKFRVKVKSPIEEQKEPMSANNMRANGLKEVQSPGPNNNFIPPPMLKSMSQPRMNSDTLSQPNPNNIGVNKPQPNAPVPSPNQNINGDSPGMPTQGTTGQALNKGKTLFA